jgi:hypothetical protein
MTPRKMGTPAGHIELTQGKEAMRQQQRDRR